MKWLSSTKSIRPDFVGCEAWTARGFGLARARARIHRSAGFTLIELMIVVAIVAILTAIAYPAYTNYITKTRRVAAEGCLSEYSNYMERYYTTNLGYDKSAPTPSSSSAAIALPQLDCATTQRTGTSYNYGFPATAGSLTSSAYTVKATPKANTAQAKRDTQCAALSINQAGLRDASPGTVAQCW